MGDQENKETTGAIATTNKNVPQAPNELQESGIKDSVNGINYAKYYTARIADYERRLAALDLSDPNVEIPYAQTGAGILAHYQEMSDDELIAEYEKLLQDNPRLWEYSTVMDETAKGANSLPKGIRNTGDPAVLSQYMEENKETLTYEQKFLIRQRIAATEKKHQKQEENNLKMSEGAELYTLPEVRTSASPNGDEAIELPDVHQKEKQSSGAGCWSVFLANLAGSRGVELSQEEIRSYRPEQDKQGAENTKAVTDDAYNKDTTNNALERGDSILAYMPGQMLSELEITQYSEEQRKNGISRAEFEQNAVEQLKTTIKHALKEDRSPVGLLAGGHYLTIIGIDGDTIKYKDSAGYHPDPDHTYTGSLASVASDVLGDPSVFGIQLTWMKEVQLSKDGRTIFGVPSDYVRMKSDGDVQGQPEPILVGGGVPANGLEIQKEGLVASRYAGTEDTKPQQNYRSVLTGGIIKTEKVYLPKKLDADYLRNKAVVRSNEEERRLRETDNSYFNLNRPLEPVMDDPGVPDYEPGMHAAEERFEAELADSWKKSIESGAEFIRNGAAIELDDIAFVTSDNRDVIKISLEDRQRAKNVCEGIFGTDLRGTPVFDSDAALQKFTYKKTPDGEPVNIWNEVESELKKDPYLAGVNNEIIRSYVRPVVLRAMINPESGLTFENGEKSVRDITAVPDEEQFPLEKNAMEADLGVFFPNAYMDNENPFVGDQISYQDAEKESSSDDDQKAPEDKTEDNKDEKTVEDRSEDKPEDKTQDIAPKKEEEKTQDIAPKQEEEKTKIQDEVPDPDEILKAIQDQTGEPVSARNADEFPEADLFGEIPTAYSDTVVEEQDNPFAGAGSFDVNEGPYAEDAEALQPNPFEGISPNSNGTEMYLEAANKNAMLFKEPETEETYAAQGDTAEKLWFTSIYLAKGHALKDAGRSFTDAEEQKKSLILEDTIRDAKSLKDAFNTLAQIETKAMIAIGEEAAEIEKKLHKAGDPKVAADYLTKDGSSMAIQMGRGCFELEFLMRERLEELKESDPETFRNIDFDRELEDARLRYHANRVKEADKAAYERGRQIQDAEIIERPAGDMRPRKDGSNLSEYDRVLHAKKKVFVSIADRMQDVFDKGSGADMPTNFANTYYKELDCLRGLTPAMEKIQKTVRAEKGFNSNLRFAMGSVNDLMRDLSYYYQKREDDSYPVMNRNTLESLRGRYAKTAEWIMDLRDKYTQYKNQKYIDANRRKRVTQKDLKPFNDVLKLIGDDLEAVNKAYKARQETTLPLAAFKYSKELEAINYVNGVFKHPGLVEYSRIYQRSNLTQEAIRKRFIESTPGQIRSEYEKALVVNPWLSEFLPTENKIPSRIENTSDVKQIEEYMKRNDLLLTDQEKAHLVNHISSSNRAESINTIAENNYNNLTDYYAEGKRKPSVIISGEDAAELDIHQDEWQSSANGSWSVAGAMMVNSLGGQRLVKQEDIRNYRPKLEEGEVIDKNGMLDSTYSQDSGRDLMEMGDAILRYAPNKMMRQLEIQPYDKEIEKKGVSPEEYLANAERLFKNQVLHIIKTDKCPMPFRKGDRYITIIGIDGDTVKYKDSREEAAREQGVGHDHTYTATVRELISDQLTGPENGRGAVQLTWLSDIKLSKDKTSVFGVPNRFATVTEDGEVLPARGDSALMAEQENTPANRDGVRFYRLGGDEENSKAASGERDLFTDGGIIKVEKAYLPKKVPMKYLVHEAEMRSPEEEQRLNETDIRMLGINRNEAYDREHVMGVVEDRRSNPDDLLDLPEVPKDNLDAPDRGSRPDAPGNGGDSGETGKDGNVDEPSDGRSEENKVPELTDAKKLEMFREIHKLATDLGKQLDQSTPWYVNRFTDTFRITDTSVEFDELKENLNILKERAQNALKDGVQITEKDLNDMLKSLGDTIESSQEYLNHKSGQFMTDSTRKDSKSKSGTEQNRIRAAVDSYEKLSSLKVDLKAAVGKQSATYAEIEKKKVLDNVKDYHDLLISNRTKDMQKMQTESYRNRTQIPERHMIRLARIEAVFGKKPEFLEEFKDSRRIKYNIEVKKGDKTKKVSAFTQLTEIKDEFKAIGPAGKGIKLSDKDFAAIAFAESSTKEVLRPEYEKLKKSHYFNGISVDTIHKNYAFAVQESISSELMNKVTDFIPFMEAARQKAVRDLKAYERGDKKPLAEVIANNLNMMTDLWKANMHANLDSGGEYLFNSEMGQRMFAMLERDPELKKLAITSGLKAETYFDLKAMERQGRNTLNSNDLFNGSIGAVENLADITNDPKWKDQDIKTERFAEMLLHEAIRQEDFKADARKEKLVDEIREFNERSDSEFVEKRRVAQAKRIQSVLLAFGDREELRKAKEKYDRRCKEEGITAKDTVYNSKKLVSVVEECCSPVYSFEDKIRNSYEDLERQLIAYYKDECDAIEERSRLQGKLKLFGDLGRLDYAVKETKKYLRECETKKKNGLTLNPAEEDKYNYLKDIMDRYASIGNDGRKMGEFRQQMQDESSYIEFQKIVVGNDLNLKYKDQNAVSEQLIGKVGEAENIKDRLKVFMKYKGYDKWDQKDFANALNGNKFGLNLIHDMLAFEKDVKSGKINLNNPLNLQPEKKEVHEEKVNQEKISEKEAGKEAAKEKEAVKETEKSKDSDKQEEKAVRVKPEFTEEMKEYLKSKVEKINGLWEAIDPLAEYFGNNDDEKLCDDLNKLSEHLSGLAESIEDEDDEKMEEAYHNVQESMEKVLLSKYHNDERQQDKTGFELLLGKNSEGMRFSEMQGGAYEFLNEISNKLGLADHLKVSDEYKQEIEKGTIKAVDKLRGRLDKLKNSKEAPIPEALKPAFDDLYKKTSSLHTASIHDLKEAAERLKADLEKTKNKEISKALNLFSYDIQKTTQGFTFMDDVAINKIMHSETVKKVPEEKNEKEKDSAKEKNAHVSIDDLQKKVAKEQKEASEKLQDKDADKITANDILDVKIGIDEKKTSFIKFDELQKKEGIGAKNGKNTVKSQKNGVGNNSTKEETKKIAIKV